MRTPITLEEFLFTLNQDEDIGVTIFDYARDLTLYNGWKTDVERCFERYKESRQCFVKNFTLMTGGIEITIVEHKEELD